MFRVLYVDDEPVLLHLGKTHLELSGNLIVETAESAREAFNLLRHRTYDGIISDYQMPVMDGIEFLREVRALYHDIPFILFTGKGREEIAIDALNNGADFYLQKGGQTKSQYAELEHAVIHVIDRKQAREELNQSRQQMADLINFLPDATFAIDLEGRVIAWNHAMEEMTGIPGTAILGSGDYAYAVPIYGERRPILIDFILNKDKMIEKQYQHLQRQGDKLISELYVPNLYNGKGAYIWFIASPLYDIRGNVIGAIEAIRDITVRKEAENKLVRTNEELHAAYEQLTATEEELRANYEELAKSQVELQKSEERYRNIVEDQTEFICRFTPDGRLSFVNEAYCRYFGLNHDTCIGSRHTVVIPPEDRRLMQQHLAALTPDNPVAIVEHRIVMPNGEIRWQRWSDRAIFDHRGRVVEYQSVGRDTTDRKEAEEKLVRTNEELHAAYEQLTATEEELRANYEELAKSQVELQKSEERYRNIVEDQTEFICRFTPDGRLSFVNEAYCRYFGLNRTTCIGSPHTIVIPQEDLKIVNQHLSALTPNNPVAIIEHRIVMPNGEIRWQRWSDRAIFDARGRIVEYQSVGRDTTDRKVAEEKLERMNEDLHAAYEQLTATEEELRQNYDELAKSQVELQKSEERYRNIVEDQTEFICRFTPDGRLSFVNEAYCRYFGLSRDTCIGSLHTVVIPPDDRKLMQQHLSSLTPDNPVAIVEHRIVMPDGEIRWQRWSDRAIFDHRGRIVEYQSVGRDTTDRKEAEEKLERMNEDLHAAYEQLTATEEELRQNYEQLTATEEELRQNYDELAKSQVELQKSEERYRNIVEDQTEFICRFTPDGRLSFVNEAYCRYFGLSRDTCIGSLHTVVIPPDDRKLMQQHLSSLTPDNPVAIVEHRIIMPSGEIRWQQWSDRAVYNSRGDLVEYQSVGRDITQRKRLERALQESNKKLNLLSSITRHDILNQLTVLQGSLELIDLNASDAEHRQWLVKAIRASEGIRSQISFTRQYQDIGVQEPKWHNIYSAVTSVCMDDGISNVSIDRQLEEVEIFADPLLRTVFSNLFENSVMHGGNITKIQVSGKVTPKGFRLVVEDDGAGIDPADKKRIFQKGFGRHTGLGLFLVREVLAITGLIIDETGEYGKGARFEILVPEGMFRNTHSSIDEKGKTIAGSPILS
ncbi:MAG: aerobic respiration control sensor protein ArcB [Methanoregula sp. PtaU1.Bin051]|nr:MAG: aerobic respiration control sensor protein ArcB [Methanoregula sp. PtaU1.Bin051]